MTTAVQSKLLKKLMALAALTVALGYLHRPDALYALTCRQECQAVEKSCITGCHGNSACQENCINFYKRCVTGCPPGQAR